MLFDCFPALHWLEWIGHFRSDQFRDFNHHNHHVMPMTEDDPADWPLKLVPSVKCFFQEQVFVHFRQNAEWPFSSYSTHHIKLKCKLKRSSTNILCIVSWATAGVWTWTCAFAFEIFLGSRLFCLYRKNRHGASMFFNIAFNEHET